MSDFGNSTQYLSKVKKPNRQKILKTRFARKFKEESLINMRNINFEPQQQMFTPLGDEPNMMDTHYIQELQKTEERAQNKDLLSIPSSTRYKDALNNTSMHQILMKKGPKKHAVPRIFRDVDLGLGDQSRVIDEQEEIDGPTPLDQSEVSYHPQNQQGEIMINTTNMNDPHQPVINVNVFGLRKMQNMSKSDEEEQTLSMGLTAHFKSVNKQKESGPND